MPEINHKEILSAGFAKALENSSVPYSVLLGVIKEMKALIKTHNDEIAKHQKELNAKVTDRKDYERLMANHERQVASLEKELVRYKSLLKGDKGDKPMKGIDYNDGYTPKKGIDYNDGYTPKKGIDYNDGHTPTIDELEAVILPLIPEAAEVDTDKVIKEIIALIKKKKLFGIDDVNGLREYIGDKTKKKTAEGFTYKGEFYGFEELMHGAGTGSGSSSIVYSTDLSSQCNGSNKIFTVPTNDAFILLSGTDSPFIYRTTVDFTGSGTTTLTLTSAVNAPSSGATLILTYKST